MYNLYNPREAYIDGHMAPDIVDVTRAATVQKSDEFIFDPPANGRSSEVITDLANSSSSQENTPNIW